MRRTAIFILSDVRSGSTLLDQCLGGHPAIVSLGEVHWLLAYLTQDRGIYDPAHPLLCTCGMPVSGCQFWTAIEKALGKPLDTLRLRQELKQRRKRRKVATAVFDAPLRLLRSQPRLYRLRAIRRLFGGPQLARDCIALYDAVAKATGRAFCVDSSKSPYRFRDVYDAEPERTIAITLVRDYRAVVHSKIKRGQPLRGAALGWRQRMQQIRALTADLPSNSVFSLKYEAFCSNPRSELERLCGVLGISFADSMLRRSTAALHHIGGSPSKFDESRIEISLDRSFENQMSADVLKQIRELVGDVAEDWGYP